LFARYPQFLKFLPFEKENNYADLRKPLYRVSAAFRKGIANALDLVCADDAHGWFKCCGYELFQP